MPWNPDLRDQNIRRVLRPGQEEKVKVHVPVITDTVDESIYEAWSRKEMIINTILKEKGLNNARENTKSADFFD